MYLFMILPVKANPGSGPRVLLASCQTPSMITAKLWPEDSAPDLSLTISMRYKVSIELQSLFLFSQTKHPQVMNDDEGYIMFKGKQNTIITYKPETKMWTMKMVNNPSVYGTSSAPFQDMLMG